jgi:hypothetical protein
VALLPREYLDYVVALGRTTGDATQWVATGFFLGHFREKTPDGKSSYDMFLVSNRHVFEGLGTEARVRLNPEPPGPARELLLTLRKDGTQLWYDHPDPTIDVAVVPARVKTLKGHGIPMRAFRSDLDVAPLARLAELGSAEGDSVFTLGYPMTLVGPERNFALVRQGCIARIRDTLAGLSREFLIDCPAFPGNSGSPVILKPEVISIAGTESCDTAYLIGVLAKNLTYSDVAVSTQTQEPRVVFQENSGLSVVFPVDHVIEVVTKVRARLYGTPLVAQAFELTPPPVEEGAVG